MNWNRAVKPAVRVGQMPTPKPTAPGVPMWLICWAIMLMRAAALLAWVCAAAALALGRAGGPDVLEPLLAALRVAGRTLLYPFSGPDFINAVVRLQTPLTAPALLDVLQDLEQQAGRERPYPNAPRTLDLDLLFYGEATLYSPRLIVPHPRWAERAFVLHPLADVSPEKVSAALMAAVADQPIEPLP